MEERLQRVTTGGAVETYPYDEAGVRVQKTAGSVMWHTPSCCQETQAGGATRRFYYLGEWLVATRVNAGAVSYVHADHLGGVVLTTEAEVGERRYAAFGGLRARAIASYASRVLSTASR